MTPPERRRFGQRDKNRLYDQANGKCTTCGTDLDDGWHADHIHPWSLGGETTRANGQALCPQCNLKKGNKSLYSDAFKPRKFQSELITVTLARVSTGETATTAVVSPGSGKTLAWQAAATELLRRERIDFVAVYAPRIILATQAETDWRHEIDEVEGDGLKTVGNFLLFDARLRLEEVRHRANKKPLIPPAKRGKYAYISTYASLVSDPTIHLEWASEHQGRFLLVADEAQFCGDGDRENEEFGGTKAGKYIEEMAQYALHTMLLTGTPFRSDGKKLILTDYRSDEKGRLHPISHAEAGYRSGVSEGYLRRFDTNLTDYRVNLAKVDDSEFAQAQVSSEELKDYIESLKPVLEKQEVWQPLVDETIARLAAMQRINPSYRALISCMEMKHAKEVADYLRQNYPQLSSLIAISEDGPRAEKALRDFKDENQRHDVLVTVRKAFIGYDCKQITVVCVLTHYRDPGHLMQLVCRGMRVWNPKESEHSAARQCCHIIAPDDEKMKQFIAFMRSEEREGIRESERHTDGAEGGGRRNFTDWYVTAATRIHSRSEGYAGSVSPDDHELFTALLNQLGPIDTPSKAQEFAEMLGITALPARPVPQVSSAPRTEAERVAEYKGRAAKLIGEYLAITGVHTSNPNYQRHRQRVQREINTAFGVTSTDAIDTVEGARAFVQHVNTWVRARTGGA